MVVTAPTLEHLTYSLTQEFHVRAAPAATFDALLEQMGPANETPDGTAISMTLEAWPGGRWFRDLGGDNGHFWGHVQAIKRPVLLEITGPLFMSHAVISNLQYRLKEVEGGTLISFHHFALGFIPNDYREGMGSGWTALFERVKRRAEQTARAK